MDHPAAMLIWRKLLFMLAGGCEIEFDSTRTCTLRELPGKALDI